MLQDSPITVPPRRGLLRSIPSLCKILALALAVSIVASGRLAQAAPRGDGASLYSQKTALDALAGGDIGRGGVCPEPLNSLPICGNLAPTECLTGVAGDECWPISVFHVPGGPIANACTCAASGTTCGPVSVFLDPVAGLRYTCDSSCPNLGEECWIFVNGVSTGSNFIAEGDPNLNIDDTITCECPPPPTYQNWVIADDFCLEGCDRCECDVNGDGTCDLSDLAFMQNCFGSTDPACRAADLNCDGIVTTADVAILQCFFAGGTAADCCPGAGAGAVIDRVRWYGSYFDPDFEPPTDGTPPLRRPDSWLVALHSDIPATPCPPNPPGTKPVDWCGTLEVCSGGTSLVFRPDGSGFTYNYSDPNNLLAGLGAGDEIRICGHDDTGLTGPCTNALNLVVIDAVSTCQSKVSRPDRLIAQWVIPDPLVTVETTGKAGWDNHRIFCYTADLGCLVHNFSDPGEIDSMGNFHPVPGKTYWISIQAAVGHTVDAACNEVTTGQTVNQDYWGWHTTPPGHQHKDDAYMGQLAMGCEGEWVYNWMSHLHSSQPPFKDCADDPNKSIDMA
ncbi:MAG: dockerin type I repeat-containing protein, partial [Planctomycetes bacterium]|nr:dockerin type I repeat-containing protein [Planctomycetota bacterium]